VVRSLDMRLAPPEPLLQQLSKEPQAREPSCLKAATSPVREGDSRLPGSAAGHSLLRTSRGPFGCRPAQLRPD
jgi:hypothetical protein